MSIHQAMKLIREPRAINFAQFLAYTITAATGVLAALGGVPSVINGTIGPVLAVIVGTLLAFGGAVGAFAVATGHWWLERIALMITGLGWVTLLPAALFFAFTPGRSSSICTWTR